jgi:glutathione S-transferase
LSRSRSAGRPQRSIARGQRLLGRAVAPVDSALAEREHLVGAFSAADVMLGHALFMASRLIQVPDEMANLKGYVKRVEDRPAFQTAIYL